MSIDAFSSMFPGKYLQEAQNVLSHSGQAATSLAWLWPIRGILFSINHPSIIFAVRGALLKSFLLSCLIFTVLAVLTYSPQATLLFPLAGPLSRILALLLVGAESLFLLTLLARPLFLEPALARVFDATLSAHGHAVLVARSKARASGAARGTAAIAGALTRPLEGGVLRYMITLPLNLVPVVGTVLFLFYNGYEGGPGWHARYFQLKGLSGVQRAAWVQQRRAEYTAFGVGTLLFSFVPLVGLVFTFTNTVGAALWAAELEARANAISETSPKAK